MKANVPIIVIGQVDPQCACDHTRSLHLVTARLCLAANLINIRRSCSLRPERRDLPARQVSMGPQEALPSAAMSVRN